ncbi:MAG: PKD domain-containing protein [Gemmatimonadales bacterium]
MLEQVVVPGSHTYAADGTFTVVLTVTDDKGAEDTESQQVTVSAPPPPQ